PISNLLFISRFLAKWLGRWMRRDLLREVRRCFDKEVTAAHRRVEDVELKRSISERVVLQAGGSSVLYILSLVDRGKQRADGILDDIFYDVVRRVISAGLATLCFVRD